jgi:hypothetical protein
MKIVFLFLFALPVFSSEVKPKKNLDKSQLTSSSALKKITKPMEKEEDCEKKAQKKIVIQPESISLTGNAGCSLEDSH